MLGASLAASFAVVAPDLRGHGQSSKPVAGYRFADHMSDLNGLMDAMGWRSAHILGHSWGAKLACVWATQQPERFKSLMLLDPFFNGTLPGWMKMTFPFFYRVLPFLKTMGPFECYDEAEALAKSLKQYRGWTEFQQQVFVDSVEQKPNGTWGNRLAIAARDEIFDDVMRVAGVSRPLDIPALFIKPEKGLNRSALQLAPYRKYLTNLQVVEVPGNHWAHMVEPVAVTGAIAQFLETQDVGC
jgi:pimeloyl-ACP methyl ester carboxylesterase